METTARLYHCARCHCQVIICSHCDRGNIYCGKSCAEQARLESQRAAGKRYQGTRRGRFKHADRQRRYRARCQKVTHQGSAPPPPNASLSPRSEAPVALAPVGKEGVHCHFCGRLCSPFLRLDYRHRTRASRASERQVIHPPHQGQAQAP